MEITILGHLFWFNIITLILCSLQIARKAFLLNVMCSIGFFFLGLCLIAPVEYVAPFSASDYLYQPSIFHFNFQKELGIFWCAFGFVFFWISVIKFLGGEFEETWGLKELEGRKNGDIRRS